MTDQECENCKKILLNAISQYNKLIKEHLNALKTLDLEINQLRETLNILENTNTTSNKV
jgi:hypothetical protein